MSQNSPRYDQRRLVPDTIQWLRSRFSSLPDYRHTDTGVLFLATVLGVAVGFSVVVFHWAVAFAEQFFQGSFSQASRYVDFRFILFPLIAAAGGLMVGILRSTVFDGIPDEDLTVVQRSVHGHTSHIDRRSSVKAIVTAALSIGSGGGAGREAPTVVLGASIGSALSKVFRLRSEQTQMLSGAGTAAAISGIFNAPLGGMMFAVELVFGDMNVRSFIPLAISSVMSTAVVRLFLGNESILISPAYASVAIEEFAILALAGVASGGIALYFLKMFRWSEARTRQWVQHVPEFLRPAVGGLGAGALVALLPMLLETSYQPVNEAIRGSGVLVFAALVVLVKPISAALTIGSGGAGGTFAPVLKTGALFGFSFGSLAALVVPGINPGIFALVCTAAVLSGTYRIPLTAALLVFEISRNYELIMPLLFASVFAAFITARSRVKSFHPADQERSGT